MNKIKLHHIIFGYRICKTDPERSARFLSKALRAGFSVTTLSESEFIIKDSDYKKMKPIINEFGAEVSKTKGLFGYLKGQKQRYGLASAILFVLLLSVISADTVWDIRISGNETVDSEIIISELKENGFDIGKRWRKTDKNKLEAQILAGSDHISWININRRGSVAYVDIIEKSVYQSNPEAAYSNIVASADCIIEQISVTSGYAAVKVGDTVKKGDVLIAGIRGENGDFCRAEGSVIGRSWSTITVEAERSAEKKLKKKKTKSGISIKIFNFNINILKNYGNSDTKYDIISCIKRCKIGSKCTLPISIITEYRQEYELVTETLSDDELIRAARDKMSEALSSQAETADLIKISTKGTFTDNGYCMISNISYTADVGTEIPFEIK